jgi:hypothetical protein
MVGKRIDETSRSLFVSVLFTDIRIQKLSDLHKATVFYRFTAVYGPFYTTWVDDAQNRNNRKRNA